MRLMFIAEKATVCAHMFRNTRRGANRSNTESSNPAFLSFKSLLVMKAVISDTASSELSMISWFIGFFAKRNDSEQAKQSDVVN